MKYFRPVGNIFCHFKSKQIATKWNGPQNSCLPVFANCHSKILKFSAQRKFGTLTNSKTYNFTDPRPYFKSSKKTTPVSFSLKEKKPILWTAKKMQSNHNYLPQIVSSKKKFASWDSIFFTKLFFPFFWSFYWAPPPRRIISWYWFKDSCLCNLISSLNLLMKASTRRFSSSWLSDGSLLSRPDPGEGLSDELSLNVSDFFIFWVGGVVVLSFSSISVGLRRTCESHVSDFFKCLVNGIERPSVIVFHVFSNVSCRFGFDTPNDLTPALITPIMFI